MTKPRLQVVVDCANPGALVRFWAAALGYVAPPPDGHDSWADWYRSVGVPADEVGDGVDRLIDPTGAGPSLWFHAVPEPKTVKNRLHLDLLVAGRGTPIAARRRIVDAEVERLRPPRGDGRPRDRRRRPRPLRRDVARPRGQQVLRRVT